MDNSVEKSASHVVMELARTLHESVRNVTSNFIEWKDLDEPTRKVFVTQANAILDTYALVPLDNPAACSGCRTLTNALNDMDESRRLKVQADQNLAKCHAAMITVIGVETDKELASMEVMLKGIAALSERKEQEEISKVVTLIQTVTETGYHNDGTCAGDAAKCCGNCGDMVGKDHPEPSVSECCAGKNCGGAAA